MTDMLMNMKYSKTLIYKSNAFTHFKITIFSIPIDKEKTCDHYHFTKFRMLTLYTNIGILIRLKQINTMQQAILTEEIIRDSLIGDITHRRKKARISIMPQNAVDVHFKMLRQWGKQILAFEKKNHINNFTDKFTDSINFGESCFIRHIKGC